MEDKNMPNILPIKELKNTANISEICNNSNEPIFITKNGYGDMVLMNIKLYEETMGQLIVAKQLKEALDDPRESIPAETVIEKLRGKYV